MTSSRSPRAAARLLASLAMAGAASLSGFAGDSGDDLAWVEERIAALRTSASPAVQARNDLNELQRRLESRGIEQDLARVLAPSAISRARPASGAASPSADPASSSADPASPSADPASRGAAQVETGDDDRVAAIHALRAAQRRIALFDGRAAPASVPGLDGSAARVRAILEDPAFDLSKTEPGILSGFFSALDRLIGRFFGATWSLVSSHPLVLKTAAALLLGGAILYFLMALARSMRGAAAHRPLPAPQRREATALAAASPGELLRAGLAAIDAGRIVPGLRLLQAAAVTSLRERGALPREPGLTDQEGIRLLSSGPTAEFAAPFRSLAAIHERAVYGGRTPEASDLRLAAGLASGLVEARGAAPGSPASSGPAAFQGRSAPPGQDS